jgi:type III pantothenate kinase
VLIDAGNTRVKWAVVNGNKVLSSGALPIEQVRELPKQLADIDSIRQIWVSNVAGEEVAQNIRNFSVSRSCQTHFIVAQKVQCGVSNSYVDAIQLGCDRWAALIAAWHLVSKECLVVNCGTATTVDTLNNQGVFTGGLILSGIELMQQSLANKAAQLKAESGQYVLFPLNTADAIFSGAIQANCGAIQRQYDLLEDGSAPIVLGGGASAILQPHLQNLPVRVADNLVLQGLLLIAQEASR